MTKDEEDVFNQVIDLVRKWQLNGFNGHCLPVLRDTLLEELCDIANDRAADTCLICNSEKVIHDYEEYRCPHCQLVP